MNLIGGLFHTTLGRKYLMAISGAALFLFVIGHMVGNLQIFLGADAINRYGHFLQSSPELLWPARLGLIAMAVIHLMAAATLTDQNTEARPDQYTERKIVDASLASRTMMFSGLIIFAFVAYHLLHFTVQVKGINGTGVGFTELHDAAGRHDVYRMMITGFSNPFVAAFYVLGVGLLCFHLGHGVGAMFQSLGLRHAAYERAIAAFAKAAALILFAGYISIPIAVQMGWIK